MNKPKAVDQTAGSDTIEEGVRGLIATRGALDPGEVIVHFDLIATTRRITPDGGEAIQRRHWAPVGADPHLSYGVLNAQAAKILTQILT